MVASGIGFLAGGVGGSVAPYYASKPILTGNPGFLAGAKHGWQMIKYELPRTAVGASTQAHLDFMNEIIQASIKPAPNPVKR